LKSSPPTAAGQTNPSAQTEQRNQVIDALTQVFALFRLNYHNQYLNAFRHEAELTTIKKLWLEQLQHFSADVILRAAKAIIEGSDYLPTLHTMIRHCEAIGKKTNLPDVHTAFLEACRAPSPKAQFAWSHPAVYFAGKATDWYFLQTSSESVAYPIFKRKYADLCERVRAGETLEIHTEAHLEHNPTEPLNKQENLEKLQALRAALDL
jgi:hypothetical protein